MNELEEDIWTLVHGWCDQQYHDIPDDSRRYLMDQIKSLVISTTSDKQSSQGAHLKLFRKCQKQVQAHQESDLQDY